MLQRGNIRVISLLVFDENIKNMKFKVLSSIVYCIMENFDCVYYICCPEIKIHVTTKGQGYENITYNAVSGIGISEILMNIISCHGFVNNTKSAVILSFCSKLVDYYLQKCFVLLKKKIKPV